MEDEEDEEDEDEEEAEDDAAEKEETEAEAEDELEIEAAEEIPADEDKSRSIAGAPTPLELTVLENAASLSSRLVPIIAPPPAPSGKEPKLSSTELEWRKRATRESAVSDDKVRRWWREEEVRLVFELLLLTMTLWLL